MSLCFVEPVGAAIPTGLAAGLRRELLDAERDALFSAVNLTTAPVGVAKPQATWVVGPSAVGKTSVTNEVLRNIVGVHPTEAVVVDGALIRDFHGGWQAVKQDGHAHSPPAVHKDAWDTFKNAKVSEKMKKEIFETAVRQRQHIVLPDCLGCIDKAAAKVKKLQAAGYEVTVAAMFAPKAVCAGRGEGRALDEGKTFSSRGYDTTMRNIRDLTARLMTPNASETPDAAFAFFDNTGRVAERMTYEQFTASCAEALGENPLPTAGEAPSAPRPTILVHSPRACMKKHREGDDTEDEGSLGSAASSHHPDMSWMSCSTSQTDCWEEIESPQSALMAHLRK